jgi:hypothetical protein
VTAFPKIVTPNAPFAMAAERRLEPLPASTGMAAICAFLPSRGAHTAARRAAASAFFRCLTEAGSPREGPRMPQTYAQASGKP